MGPPARSDRHDEPRAFNQFVPVEAAMVEDIIVVGENPVESQLSRMYCQMFSTGLSSGDLDGRGTSVMFSGTPSFAVTCHPARAPPAVQTWSYRLDKATSYDSNLGNAELVSGRPASYRSHRTRASWKKSGF